MRIIFEVHMAFKASGICLCLDVLQLAVFESAHGGALAGIARYDEIGGSEDQGPSSGVSTGLGKVHPQKARDIVGGADRFEALVGTARFRVASNLILAKQIAVLQDRK